MKLAQAICIFKKKYKFTTHQKSSTKGFFKKKIKIFYKEKKYPPQNPVFSLVPLSNNLIAACRLTPIKNVCVYISYEFRLIRTNSWN